MHECAHTHAHRYTGMYTNLNLKYSHFIVIFIAYPCCYSNCRPWWYKSLCSWVLCQTISFYFLYFLKKRKTGLLQPSLVLTSIILPRCHFVMSSLWVGHLSR